MFLNFLYVHFLVFPINGAIIFCLAFEKKHSPVIARGTPVAELPVVLEHVQLLCLY